MRLEHPRRLDHRREPQMRRPAVPAAEEGPRRPDVAVLPEVRDHLRERPSPGHLEVLLRNAPNARYASRVKRSGWRSQAYFVPVSRVSPPARSSRGPARRTRSMPSLRCLAQWKRSKTILASASGTWARFPAYGRRPRTAPAPPRDRLPRSRSRAGAGRTSRPTRRSAARASPGAPGRARPRGARCPTRRPTPASAGG